MSHQHRSEIESDSGLTEDQIEDFEAQFAAQQTIVNLCCIPSGLAFFFIAHAILAAISNWLVNSDGIAGYRVPYQSVILWFFPGFGALSLCFEITLQIWALFVGQRVVELYSDWDSRQPKKSRGGIVYYDARKVLRGFALLLVFPIGIFTSLALNMHTTFGDDGIHEFGYAFAKQTFHSYQDIRNITLVSGAFDKHGKFISRPAYVLDFADGHRWSQANWDDSAKGIQVSLAAILARKTQLPTVDVESIHDLQLPARK
ncbi:hypothetical protein [Acidicapsa ligni]|uniref:hypothetical protein n=1 Tax=Acidicapsa ligni TaxID=542300 RepID=UPI0021E06E1E|nr:hypothetical protein [Acidicapsa ligni]